MFLLPIFSIKKIADPKKNNENKSNEKIKQEYSHSDFGEVEIKDKTFSVSLYSDLTQITFVNIILEDLNNRE